MCNAFWSMTYWYDQKDVARCRNVCYSWSVRTLIMHVWLSHICEFSLLKCDINREHDLGQIWYKPPCPTLLPSERESPLNFITFQLSSIVTENVLMIMIVFVFNIRCPHRHSLKSSVHVHALARYTFPFSLHTYYSIHSVHKNHCTM